MTNLDTSSTETVERIAVEELPPKLRMVKLSPPPELTPQTSTPEPVPAEPPEPREPRTSEVLYTAFAALGYALSARALLLLALLGAIGLGVMAMLRGGWMPLAILGVYAVLTVLPVVYLEINKRA